SHPHASQAEHPYICATSSYLALIQLYTQSSQLDTRLLRFLCLGDCTPWCTFGCNEIESIHHLFVHCPEFHSL
ncbi:hypothetical protein F5880DRAFT_1491513, partial [Lentinula raphanica]